MVARFHPLAMVLALGSGWVAGTALAQGATPARGAQHEARASVHPRRVHALGRIERRLTEGARRNGRATGEVFVLHGVTPEHGQIRSGTAFLVASAGADGQAPMMTNHHVIEGAAMVEGRREAILVTLQSASGALEVREAHTIAGSPELDYAILKVNLSGATHPAPVRLADRPLEPHSPVYTVGFPGASRLNEGASVRRARTDRNRAVPTERDEPGAQATASPFSRFRHTVARWAQRNFSVISTGQESLAPPGDTTQWYRALRRHDTTSVLVAPGSSGSGLFARDDHAAIGLVQGAFRRPDDRPAAASTPMHRILADLRQKVRTLEGADQARIQELLDRAR